MASRNWRIDGRYVEYCNCDFGCPCEFMAEPTYGYCTGLVAFKIDKGFCEDVWPAENPVMLRFGTNLPISVRSVMPCFSMVSGVNALIATGTS